MIKSTWTWVLFGAAVIAQWAAPASMIYRAESVLHQGHAFKFKTAPVDPYDAFRGRYIALSFEASSIPWPSEVSPFPPNAEVYATVETGPDGFAYFSRVTLEKPAGACIKVRAGYVWDKKLHLTLPFDRFYMPEDLAPKAEGAYAQNSRRGQQQTWAVVRVRDGAAVIENVYIAGKPIADFVREQAK